MLRPTKYSHPDRTVVAVSVLLLKSLKKERVVEFNTLRGLVKSKVEGGDVLFFPALNLLYLLGLIEYLPHKDVFEYVGSNEVI